MKLNDAQRRMLQSLVLRLDMAGTVHHHPDFGADDALRLTTRELEKLRAGGLVDVYNVQKTKRGRAFTSHVVLLDPGVEVARGMGFVSSVDRERVEKEIRSREAFKRKLEAEKRVEEIRARWLAGR